MYALSIMQIRIFHTDPDKGHLSAGILGIQPGTFRLVTANGNFKILEDGSIEAKNAKIKG